MRKLGVNVIRRKVVAFFKLVWPENKTPLHCAVRSRYPLSSSHYPLTNHIRTIVPVTV